MTPSQKSQLPISLFCPWTNNYDDYLKPRPQKDSQWALAVSIDSASYPFPTNYLAELSKYITVAIYDGSFKNSELPYPREGDNWIHSQIQVIGLHKFALVFETVNLTDWISHRISQAFLAGSVPVYLGTENIDKFIPGNNSIIKASSFEGPRQLSEYLKSLDQNDQAYDAFFKWKEGKIGWRQLADGFVSQLENCVYYSECRLCKFVQESICPQKKQENNASEEEDFQGMEEDPYSNDEQNYEEENDDHNYEGENDDRNYEEGENDDENYEEDQEDDHIHH